MPFVGPALTPQVEAPAGAVAKLGVVAASHDLKFKNRILIELCGGAAVDFVAVGHAVDQAHGIAPAFSKNGSRAISGGILLAIAGHPRHQLTSPEILSALTVRLLDLSSH